MRLAIFRDSCYTDKIRHTLSGAEKPFRELIFSMKPYRTNRPAGFLIIIGIYIAASAVGILLYRVLSFSFWLDLLIADVAATVVTFAGSLLLKNASVYDPYWSVQPMVILLYAAGTKGLDPLRWLLLICVCLWGIRLTANWAYTFRDLEHQDWRYTMLREKTGKLYPAVNFAGIHLFPTVVVYLCILPAVFAFHEQTAFNPLCILFFLVSVAATVLQGVADWQMHKFRREIGRGFIRTGCWKYARHPNYLGEILMWWGVGLCVVCVMPQRWYLLAGALLNTLMFLVISIPMADKRQSAKAGFEEYRQTTHMLLPFKKKVR